MKRVLGWSVALAAALIALWFSAEYVNARRYARPGYAVEDVDAITYTLEIPKGWQRTDYANQRESPLGFTTSTSARDHSDPYFVFGSLDIDDNGSQSVESVIADWRKGQPNSEVSRARLGAIEASAWTSQLPMVEMAGEARTFVFRGTNGHVYSAHYQLAPRGGYRMRQDYVFGRIFASIKFKPHGRL